MIAFLISIIVIGITLVLSYPISDIKELIRSCGSLQHIIIKDSRGQLLAKSGHLQNYVTIDQIPKSVILALLATEDQFFWGHFGFNLWAMMNAIKQNIQERKISRGGSTITQQLAKNILFCNDPSLIKRKTERKLKELILTCQLEVRLSKAMILEYYLNRVYFGRGAYGITAAARLHFDKKLEELTIAESAFLIGLIQAPSAYSASTVLGQKRMQHVLKRMYKVGGISSDVFLSESSSDVVQIPHKGEIQSNPCISWIIEQIPEWIKESNKAIIVNTTLDVELQKKIITKIPDIKNNSRFDFTQLSFILCDLDGAVKVMIGGLDSYLYGFNRATQSVRPAGSTFKIYVYLSALLRGMKPESVFDDSTPTIGKWSPSNYYHNEVGLITATRAFSESVNGATVRIAMEYGLENIINTARLLGITRAINNDCSLILGSVCVSPYELAHSMLIIANDGEEVTPYCIKSIKDYETGDTLWQNQEEKVKIKLIDDDLAFDNLRYIMAQVVESPKGTGRSIANKRYRIMAKTGTSQEYRDIWFIGMSETGSVFVAWCGNDNYAPMNRSEDPKKKNPAIEISKIALDEVMAGYSSENASQA